MEGDEKSATILAVDDTPENLDIVKGILVDDYNIRVAAHGKVALKIAETQSPDLILLDIMMPEMDGYEVCRQLKANPVTQDIPVIFLTAKGETADEAEGFKLGAADYILKPVKPPPCSRRG
jgi:CheY-like chemotaxis protein